MNKEWIQESLGWIVVKVTKATKCRQTILPYTYWVPTRFNKSKWGVCLGTKYIICVKPTRTTLLHEYGHSVQSSRLGWKYLFTVGIVSFTRNIWDRLFHKKWDMVRRAYWYYKNWPEDEADELGGVTR